jgi:ATP-dependent DNA ligase
VNGAARSTRLTRQHPASYVAFGVLVLGGADQRRRPGSSRRNVLEDLAAGWVPPLQLSSVTYDIDEARQWCADYRLLGIVAWWSRAP